MEDQELRNVNRIIEDSEKELAKSEKLKTKIIVLLLAFIIFILSLAVVLEPIYMFHKFVEYQETVIYEITEISEDKDKVDVNTEGENASIEYSNVEGNQYKDNSIHNETEKEGNE